ncbi:fatty-acyl coenzyme A oxidase [Lobulomyces angularis]|nr:fatty-acyl coenzyme A oxidase [Lobulomyces angularis]
MGALDSERLNPSFNVRELTYLLDGGKQNTELRENIMLSLQRDPVFDISDYHDLDLQTIREKTMQKVRRMAFYLSQEPVPVSHVRMQLLSLLDPGAWTRVGVHYGLFFNTVRGQATPEQFGYWVAKGAIALNGVTGCFAMTELGHGSNVAGLETTATYDEASDEFIIHTPTLTATKWWIGGAAQTANHAVVFAQLIVKGKKFGVKSFVVQLRDKDFRLLPGVVIGDIGAKMGRHGTDNGWIQFTYLRIPRSHMLMKHTKVHRDGTVIEPPLQQLAYGALINGRVSMVVDSGNVSKKALTVALRYAAVRRQFGGSENEPETKLLDYIIHQHRLIPLVAQTFAMHFTGVEVNSIYEDLMTEMECLRPGDANAKAVLENLRDVHGTSAGLKAFCTWMCLKIIDECRQSLGGHGYSAYTGLSSLYSDFAVQCTWCDIIYITLVIIDFKNREGDNTILTLQAGRYLIGCYRDSKKGIKQPKGVSYLNNLAGSLNKISNAKASEEIASLESLGEAFDFVVANVVKNAGEHFESLKAKGLSDEQAYEECSSSRLLAAKLHSYGYLFHRFKDAVKKTIQPDLKSILEKLCLLYGLHTIQENSGSFLEYKYFNSTQIDWVRERVTFYCKLLRKDCIILTDSWNLSDHIINSPLGRFDGNVYEHYFNLVKKHHQPGAIPSYFNKEILPMLNRSLVQEDPLEIDDEE